MPVGGGWSSKNTSLIVAICSLLPAMVRFCQLCLHGQEWVIQYYNSQWMKGIRIQKVFWLRTTGLDCLHIIFTFLVLKCSWSSLRKLSKTGRYTSTLYSSFADIHTLPVDSNTAHSSNWLGMSCMMFGLKTGDRYVLKFRFLLCIIK